MQQEQIQIDQGLKMQRIKQELNDKIEEAADNWAAFQQMYQRSQTAEARIVELETELAALRHKYEPDEPENVDGEVVPESLEIPALSAKKKPRKMPEAVPEP